ncbi:LLM class F420-dependent oxidoreductase [Lentzea sp. NPDC054927]
MKIGLMAVSTPPFDSPRAAREVVRLAEHHGVDSLWVADHVVIPAGRTTPYPYSADGDMPHPPEQPHPDSLTWLAFAAGASERVRLVTGMLVLPQRNPVVTAKQVATLDHLSGGRVSLGVGLGWMREEFEAIGADFDTRVERFDEWIGVLRALWSSEETFEGKHFQFRDARCYPKPAGQIPLVMGGHSKAAARRAGRLADAFCPIADDPAPLFAECRRAAEEAGRDPSSIELMCGVVPATVESVERLAALGVTEVIVLPPMVPVDELADAFAEFAETTLRPLREI